MPNEVVATLKGDGSAPWIVAHGDEVADAERLVEDALKGSFFQTVAEASTLFSGAVKVANGMQNGQQAVQQPQQDWQGQQRQALGQNQNQGYGQQSAPVSQFNGTPHPQGILCQMCSSQVVGKQPKPGGKRLWCCPNQRAKGDGHFVQWIND